MAVPAFVQEKAGWVYDTSSPYTLTVTPTSTTTGNNAIIVNVAHAGCDYYPTISDSAGNTYTQINRVGSGDGTNDSWCSQFACFGANAATWVMSTITTSGKINAMQVAEFSGVDSMRATVKYVGANTSLSASNTAGDLIMCMMGGFIVGDPDTIVAGGTGYSFLTKLQHNDTGSAYVLHGGWKIASVDNSAGASWTNVGTHGLITTSFVPKADLVTYGRRIVIG